MPEAISELEALLVAILLRFQQQNGAAVDQSAVNAIAARLGQLVEEYGLPPPVASESVSDATRLPDADCAARATLAAEGADPLVADATRQLVKALFYPELGQCRSSFEAVTSDGSCRRQELDRVRKRVSGTHCVDCPHWRAFSPTEHRSFLAEHWRTDPAALNADLAVFLPEDFRALRLWVAAHRGPS